MQTREGVCPHLAIKRARKASRSPDEVERLLGELVLCEDISRRICPATYSRTAGLHVASWSTYSWYVCNLSRYVMAAQDAWLFYCCKYFLGDQKQRTTEAFLARLSATYKVFSVICEQSRSWRPKEQSISSPWMLA